MQKANRAAAIAKAGFSDREQMNFARAQFLVALALAMTLSTATICVAVLAGH